MLRVFCLLLFIPLILGADDTTNTASSVPPPTDLTILTQPGRHIVYLKIDDYDRKFIFITPKDFKRGESLPIVFFFHGAGGTAAQASHTYGWAEKAEKEKFFAVFPEGLPAFIGRPASLMLNPHIWRDQRAEMQVSTINDVHFFEELLNRIEAVVPIDFKRVYVTGFSNGAGMSFTLGSHFSDRIAAIAPVSSQSFVKVTELVRPLPVYYLTGTADPLIPYNGGKSTLPWGISREMPPVQETVDLWAKLDGCPPVPQTLSDQDGVRILRYGPGKAGSEVLFTTLTGNGHHWPGSVEPLPAAISGPSLDPFKVTDRIWDFFKAHPLP